MKYLRIAFNLLTVLPVPAPADWKPGDSGRAAIWYPLVGLALGLMLNAAYWLFNRVFPGLAASALLTAVWVCLSGGLHLDGLGDCCDGLLYAGSPEKRLEIMKDPRKGSFGVIGLALAILLRFAALASLPASNALWALFLAPSLARWLLLPAGRQPLARPDGMGADFAAGLTDIALWLGAVFPLIPAVLLGLRGLLAVGAALLTALIILVFARRRIGGVSGDVFGLIVECAETVVLIMVSARL